MIIGYKNNVPQKITIKRPCQGYYLRWYYNGWHYFFFHPGQQSLITDGEKYRTIGTKSVLMGSGQITFEQCQAIRTILNTREIYILTSDGWKNISITPGSLVVYDNQVNGYEVELSVKIGSKEISQTGFSPIQPIPPLYNPNVITIITVIDGVFTIIVSGTAGETITIDWGDGSAPEVITLTGGDQTITHDYTGSGGAEHVITIDGEQNIITLDLSNDDIIVINIPDNATKLTELDLSGNLLTETPIIPDTVPLVTLDMTGNPLTTCEIQIGTQVWMCKNYDSEFPGSKVYNNDELNRAIYGGLYNQDQVMTLGFCPPGWHVPTSIEWNTLITFLGGETIAGEKLKEIGTTHWNVGMADNSSGFTARGGGYGYISGGIIYYFNLKNEAHFWTKTAALGLGSRFVLAGDQITVSPRPYTDRTNFLSVRLIKNWLAPIPPVTYNDYFLPSKDELNAMKVELYDNGIGNFTDGVWYDSSSEKDSDNNWKQSFTSGIQSFGSKASDEYIRACRAFTSVMNYNLRDVGPAGGLIFWKSGNDYLEAASSDQSTSQIWSDAVGLIGTTGTAIGTGQANTTAIINQVGHTDSAAKLCNDLVIVYP